MIFIKHRVNTANDLQKTSAKYGVEIDLRSNKKEIYLSHDPFVKGDLFKNWIKFFKHKIIVLNVKEEGLETEIIKILKKNKIKNYFFHDQTFSTLLKLKNKMQVSVRYSEYEDIKNKDFIFSKVKWLWLDNFNKVEIDKQFDKYLKKNNVKICLVSPELVKKERKGEIKIIFRNLKKNRIFLDAVCTKVPALWESLDKKYK